MDASAYFETDPWTEIEKTVRSGALGPIAEIAVQAGPVVAHLDQDAFAPSRGGPG